MYVVPSSAVERVSSLILLREALLYSSRMISTKACTAKHFSAVLPQVEALRLRGKAAEHQEL